MTAPPDLLQTIVAATARTLATRRAHEPDAALETRALAGRVPRGSAFEEALGRAGRVNVIAECKRRSPSKGVLAAEYDPARIACAYTEGGAAAISVLTEPSFFDGSLAHLAAVRAVTELPLLRKDFTIDRYQLLEARVTGADAILLIVAALSQPDLVRLQQQAWDLGLAVLVEVHDEAELDRAVAAGARLIGVNNRNLRTLAVDVDASRRLAARIPASAVAVSESGLSSKDELRALTALGYRAFLMGERFMTDPNPAAAIAGMVGA